MNYYSKYLKYKNKYLLLKYSLNNIQIGGDKPFLKNDNRINFFIDGDEEMDQFLNPVYGLILSESGFIINNYWLGKNNFLSTEESNLIIKISKDIPGSVQPTNVIMNLKPIDFGRYIAIKYINKHINFIIVNKNKIVINQINNEYKLSIGSGVISKTDKILLEKYVNVFNKYVKLIDLNDKIYFHIILYCLYWNTNNYSGIIEYYSGINEVFTILNKYFKPEKQYHLIDTSDKLVNVFSFESILIKITQKEFKIYNQEWVYHFCIQKLKPTYPDCGEVTARNLINLFCFDDEKFNLTILEKLNPIPELIEYYRVFNNFNLQSDENILLNIYGECMNSRDAWSKLIIKYAFYNINFIKSCDNTYGYELNAGLSQNNETSNFFQLIKNLLNINKWDDLLNDYIKEIEDNTVKGIGEISIYHEKYENIEIHCQSEHYYMELIKNESEKINYSLYNEVQQSIIKILLRENIKLSNYIWINYDSNLLVDLINNQSTNTDLKLKLFELSLTNLFDSDLRRRIEIDVDTDFFINIPLILNSNKKCNEYTYLSTDYEFIKRMPLFKDLNSKLKNKLITSIDLSPLSNITTIGDGFLANCRNLTSIDLSLLSNITTIGDGFLANCGNLISIDLSSITQIKSIGDRFLLGCYNLRWIDLIPLSNITSIGNRFLSSCSNLDNIDLSPLSNITTIGDGFLANCANLISIELSSMTQIKSIGNRFLLGCINLKRIDLSLLSNITSISDEFLSDCINLTSINLSSSSNITEIGNGFLSRCNSLRTIDLSPLSNITSISDGFLSGCNGLTMIDLSPLFNITSICDFFLYDCINLTCIKCTMTQKKLIENKITYEQRQILQVID